MVSFERLVRFPIHLSIPMLGAAVRFRSMFPHYTFLSIGLILAIAEVSSWSFDSKSYSWKNKSHRHHNEFKFS